MEGWWAWGGGRGRGEGGRLIYWKRCWDAVIRGAKDIRPRSEILTLYSSLHTVHTFNPKALIILQMAMIIKYGPTITYLLMPPYVKITFVLLNLKHRLSTKSLDMRIDPIYRKTIKFKFFTLLYIPTLIPDDFEWNCWEGGDGEGGGGMRWGPVLNNRCGCQLGCV
jgi:hypothetical protein